MCAEACASEEELQEYVKNEYEHPDENTELGLAERAELFQDASELLEEEGFCN